MKHILLKMENGIYTYTYLDDIKTTEDKLLLVDQEIAYIKEELEAMKGISKLISRRRTELNNFIELRKLLHEKINKEKEINP